MGARSEMQSTRFFCCRRRQREGEKIKNLSEDDDVGANQRKVQVIAKEKMVDVEGPRRNSGVLNVPNKLTRSRTFGPKIDFSSMTGSIINKIRRNKGEVTKERGLIWVETAMAL